MRFVLAYLLSFCLVLSRVVLESALGAGVSSEAAVVKELPYQKHKEKRHEGRLCQGASKSETPRNMENKKERPT